MCALVTGVQTCALPICAPMAENLLKAGYTLSAHDLNEVAVRRLVELGGRAAFSAYDAATEADIVITMLPNDAIVNAIYQGSGGLIERLAHRPLLIDSSTIAPETARTLSSAAKAKGYARSEEHTSELQSLMRNSYAVFCLKK